MYNTWLPDNEYTVVNGGISPEYSSTPEGGALKFTLTNPIHSLVIVKDHFFPYLEITKPPKIKYKSTQEIKLILKDSDGWLWSADMYAQPTPQERGWSWDQFTLFTYQDPSKTGLPNPLTPATGNLEAIQFNGVPDTPYPVDVYLHYISGRTPVGFSATDINRVTLEFKMPQKRTLYIGDVELVGAIRKEIKYQGALPFAYAVGGPNANHVGTRSFKGPYIVGYQSGTPWVGSTHPDSIMLLDNMLNFVSASQDEFKNKHPSNLDGPFMHCYLPAIWDSVQTGDIDSWVWEAPDGNPTWNGWQYRAFEGMGRTMYALRANQTSPQFIKAKNIVVRFFDWLKSWLETNPMLQGVPDDWAPTGWSVGMPFSNTLCLDPKFLQNDSHAIALALKAVCAMSACGIKVAEAKQVGDRLYTDLISGQYMGTGPMHGAMTLNPANYIVYGFHQGEVLGAFAWYKKHIYTP